MTQREHKNSISIEGQLARIFRLGIILSVAIIALGLVLFILANPTVAGKPPIPEGDLATYFVTHELLDPVNMMMIGIAMLILTPIFRVLTTIVIFINYGDKHYTLFTVLVLVIIILSILFGFMLEA
ncbi:MAG: DUF1634 domain-containing protein [Streptococcaceae bacterium]|jgi:uncharacterized membrane protein|nr:DUF1634 domain-containing protein [Streptococcaceae bacterium]